MPRKYTIRQFEAQFPDDKACLAYLFKARWPQGVTCAHCQRVSKHFPRSTQRAYSCMNCGTLVFPTAGTIFHKSPTPLRLWFYAMFIMASTRCGVSAKQLERELGVTYKTAWRMFKQIRMLMEEDAHDLSGPVEMDESYFGGFKAPKTIVAGIVERKRGRVTARVTTVSLQPSEGSGVDVRDADGASSGRGCAARRSRRWNAERVRGSFSMPRSYHNLSTVREGIVTHFATLALASHRARTKKRRLTTS